MESPLHPLSQKWLYVERPEGRPPYNRPNKLSTTPWGVEDAAPYKRKCPWQHDCFQGHYYY